MLSYEELNRFRELLEKDQAPTVRKLCDVSPMLATDPITQLIDTVTEVKTSSYEEGRKIYSIQFECSSEGLVSTVVHVQWPLMEQLMQDHWYTLRWSSSGDWYVHITLERPDEVRVFYKAVLGKYELKKLWERVFPKEPVPEKATAGEIWDKMYRRGGFDK